MCEDFFVNNPTPQNLFGFFSLSFVVQSLQLSSVVRLLVVVCFVCFFFFNIFFVFYSISKYCSHKYLYILFFKSMTLAQSDTSFMLFMSLCSKCVEFFYYSFFQTQNTVQSDIIFQSAQTEQHLQKTSNDIRNVFMFFFFSVVEVDTHSRRRRKKGQFKLQHFYFRNPKRKAEARDAKFKKRNEN